MVHFIKGIEVVYNELGLVWGLKEVCRWFSNKVYEEIRNSEV
jgi:hypothetical protein